MFLSELITASDNCKSISVKATHTIYWNNQYATYIELPVIKKYRERGQKWLVNSDIIQCGNDFESTNHKRVYDCTKIDEKKAVTIVAAFLLSGGECAIINNVIVAKIVG